MTRTKFNIKKKQLEKCQKIFAWHPSQRSMIDLQDAMAATRNLYFFQNIPVHVHLALCRTAAYRAFEAGQCVFDMTEQGPAMTLP
eukprot:19895-Rhodomonas_salina.1